MYIFYTLELNLAQGQVEYNYVKVMFLWKKYQFEVSYSVN